MLMSVFWSHRRPSTITGDKNSADTSRVTHSGRDNPRWLPRHFITPCTTLTKQSAKTHLIPVSDTDQYGETLDCFQNTL